MLKNLDTQLNNKRHVIPLAHYVSVKSHDSFLPGTNIYNVTSINPLDKIFHP